mmetsp:Transcript_11624/g.31312  ORF Transcript_11624/g.31312 Transcript_11624/m.31312 type:complete len:314 (+) Transcript_11624:738-1679(+)
MPNVSLAEATSRPSACCASRRMRFRDAALRRSEPESRAASRRLIFNASASRSERSSARNASGFSALNAARRSRSSAASLRSASRCCFAFSRTAFAARSAFKRRLSRNSSAPSLESAVARRRSSRCRFSTACSTASAFAASPSAARARCTSSAASATFSVSAATESQPSAAAARKNSSSSANSFLLRSAVFFAVSLAMTPLRAFIAPLVASSPAVAANPVPVRDGPPAAAASLLAMPPLFDALPDAYCLMLCAAFPSTKFASDSSTTIFPSMPLSVLRAADIVAGAFESSSFLPPPCSASASLPPLLSLFAGSS